LSAIESIATDQKSSAGHLLTA